jgi:type IV pilus assembly protein PilB
MENGMISLRQSGLTKIKDGVTTIEEVLRETVKDGEIQNDKNTA